MARFLGLVVLATFALSSVHAFANPRGCSGACNNAHDPSIIRRDDGTYFRFSTGGKIAIHTAPSLTGPWTYKGAMLPKGSSIGLQGHNDLWAPDVRKVGNDYYVYYSVSTFGSQASAIGVARSSSMNVGTWTDLGSTGIVSSGSTPYNAIDGNLLQANGKLYMTFGSYWKGLYQVEMKNPPTYKAANPYAVAARSNGENIEGAYLYAHGGYYYLFFSKGACCGFDSKRPAAGKEYRILVCRSSSPTGVFTDKNGKPCTDTTGTLVLGSHDFVYGPGGQGVYDDPTYGPVLYYHYVDTRIGYADGQKKFGWNQINFSSGWPVV